MASLCRSPSSLSRAPLEDDDLLAEILLRLPWLPSSLPSVSAVCSRWRALVSDPRFSRRFRPHHRRNPPLLGCFVSEMRWNYFVPALEAPNRIPEGRFSFPIDGRNHSHFQLLGCRHGLVLSFHNPRKQLLVWDSVIGDQHCIDLPPGLDPEVNSISEAVFRTVGDGQHFQVVSVGTRDMQHKQPVASIYSSETGVWGNLITALPLSEVPTRDLPTLAYITKPAVMAGDSLYWQLKCNNNFIGMIEFDLVKQSLAIIQGPVRPTGGSDNFHTWDILTESCGICVLFLTGFGLIAQLWKRKIDCDGIASWAQEKTIELDKLIPNLDKDHMRPWIVGFAEENNVVLLRTSTSVFAVQLESLQIKRLFKSVFSCSYYPFEGVYTADMGIDGGHDGAKLLQNT